MIILCRANLNYLTQYLVMNGHISVKGNTKLTLRAWTNVEKSKKKYSLCNFYLKYIFSYTFFISVKERSSLLN